MDVFFPLAIPLQVLGTQCMAKYHSSTIGLWMVEMLPVLPTIGQKRLITKRGVALLTNDTSIRDPLWFRQKTLPCLEVARSWATISVERPRIYMRSSTRIRAESPSWNYYRIRSDSRHPNLP